MGKKNVCCYIYLDDERMREYPERILSLPAYLGLKNNYDVVIPMVARTVDAALTDMDTAARVQSDIFLDLDHDLGENTPSGYDLCKLIIKSEIPIVGFTIHSMNSVGRRNMSQLLTHYGYKEY